MSEAIIRHNSPGPVADAFMQSRAFVDAIQGPIGAGKTSTVLMKLIRLAAAQSPSPRDGVRYFKACVVHQNYRQLWRSTIPSWWKWMSQDTGKWEGGRDGPASHEIKFDVQGAGRIHFKIEFVAIGDNRAEDVLRGYEPTVFFLTEADLLSEDVFTFALGRAGRYPAMADGGASYWGVQMDFNAPEADSWIESRIIMPQDAAIMARIREAFDRAVLARANASDITVEADVRYFCQPGAFEPGAENLHNLPPGYYDLQMLGQPDWYIQRMIHNKTGFSRHGKVIYAPYNDRLHCSPARIEPVKGLPITLGADAGGTPAGTVGQKMPNGQNRVLAEITTPDDEFTGPVTFGEKFNELLKDRFDGFAIDAATLDPSATFGGDQNNLAWANDLARVMKINWRPAPTNALTPRFGVINNNLTRLIDGVHPAYLISGPDCPILRKACANGYRFKARQIGGAVTYADQPEKNRWSHVAEAEQYRMLGTTSYSAVMGRGADRDRENFAMRQAEAITDDTPQGEVARLLGGHSGGRDEDFL